MTSGTEWSKAFRRSKACAARPRVDHLKVGMLFPRAKITPCVVDLPTDESLVLTRVRIVNEAAHRVCVVFEEDRSPREPAKFDKHVVGKLVDHSARLGQ